MANRTQKGRILYRWSWTWGSNLRRDCVIDRFAPRGEGPRLLQMAIHWRASASTGELGDFSLVLH